MNNEVLNQEQNEVEVDFFDDEFEPVIEENEEVEEPKEEEVSTPTETETKEETQQIVKVKFNGEEKELTMEEAITYAQKGMNYDKVASERDSLRNSTEIKLLRDIAQANGMSVNDLLINLQNANDSQKKAKIYNDLKAKYPNAEEEVLTQLTEAEFKQKTEERKKEIEELSKKETATNQQKQINAFLEKYPNLDPKEVITEDVMNEVKQGATLIEAYQSKLLHDKDIEINELKKQLEGHIQNEKNRKGTSKPLQSVGADMTDAFLTEWGKD